MKCSNYKRSIMFKNIKDSYLLTTTRYLMHVIIHKKKIYLWYMIIEMILKVLFSIFTVLLPMYIIQALGNKDLPHIVMFVAVFIGGELLFKCLMSFIELKAHMCEEWFDKYFSEEYSKRCMMISFEYTESKEKMDKIKNAADGLSWSGNVACIIDAIKEVVSAIFSIISVAAIVFTKAPLLVLIVLICVLAKAKIEAKELEEMENYYNDLSGLNRKMDYYFHEMSNYKYGKDIRLYKAKRMLLERAQLTNKENAQKMQEAAKNVSKVRSLSSTIEEIITAIQYLYVGFFALLKGFGVAHFTMLIGSTAVMADAMKTLFEEYQNMIFGSKYFDWYRSFMCDEEWEVETGNSLIDRSIKDHIISFEHVKFKYPGASDKYVLDDVSFEIHTGEKVALVGLNGEGKTTLIKLLCGLYRVSSGAITLDGKDIWEYDRKDYYEFLSVVFQDFVLFAKPIVDNIFLGKGQDMSMCNNLLEKFHMQDKVASLPEAIQTNVSKEFDSKGFEPSGGEGQKIALMRAVCREADLLILDEPTAALDPVAEHSFYSDIQTGLKDKTILFVSHRLASCRFCDKIVVLAEGKVKELGTHEDLMSIVDGLYHTMFMAQAENYS